MTNITQTYEENQTKNEELRLICTSCPGETKHLVVQSYDVDGVEKIPEQSAAIKFAKNYQIVRCRVCDAISFRHLIWSSDYTHDYGDGKFEQLYPSRVIEVPERKYCSVQGMPKKLDVIYRETIDALNFDAYTLCAGGLRALLEGICKTQGIEHGEVLTNSSGSMKRKSNLEGKIEGLHQAGILSRLNCQELHKHRYLGNEALHELQRPSGEELNIAIDILEHILFDLYELPEKGKELKRRKLVRQSQ